MNESLLTLNPPRDLLFKGPLGPPGPAIAKLVLHNRSSTDRIGFKMKTLDPSRYVVRPSKGFIEPASCVTLHIRCKPVRDLAAFNMNRQKLMVQSLVALTPEDTLTDLFADAQREVIYIDKIKCVFECTPGTTEDPSEAVDQPESSASIQSDQSFESVSSLTSQVSVKDAATKQAPVSSDVKSSATEPTEPTTQPASENSSQTKEEPKDCSVPENETLELNPKEEEEAKLTSVEPTSTKPSSDQPGGVDETNSVSGLCTNPAAVQSVPNCSSEQVACLQSSLLNRRNVIIATAAIGGIALFVLIWHKYCR